MQLVKSEISLIFVSIMTNFTSYCYKITTCVWSVSNWLYNRLAELERCRPNHKNTYFKTKYSNWPAHV